jgi:hypothetical protein
MHDGVQIACLLPGFAGFVAGEIEKLVDDGKADEAGAILKQIGTLEADVLKLAKAPAPIPIEEDRILPQRPLLERMAGEWFNPNRNEKRVFSPDGKFSQLRKGAVEVGPVPVFTDGPKAACTLGNGARFEAWLIDENRLAFVYYGANGRHIGDGEVWFRK